MKKKKNQLKLDDFKVESFVTSNEEDKMATVKGGRATVVTTITLSSMPLPVTCISNFPTIGKFPIKNK